MRIITRSLQKFGSLNAQAVINKNRNSVRFQAQNLNWDYQVTEYHCKAFAKGLKGVSFGQNDNILIRVPSSQQAESYVAKVGSSYINSNLIISKANSIDDLDKQIAGNKIKGIIFEPTLPLGQNLLIESLNQLMPELKNCVQGSQISVSRYSALKMLIQTNFYTYPGVYKYRSIFNYANDDYSPFSASTKHEPIQLPKSTNTLLITEPAHDFAFRAGILNSLVNGRYVVCAEPNDVSRIGQAHNHQLDLLATQQCPIHDDVNVYVQKGSKLFTSHKNRFQI